MSAELLHDLDSYYKHGAAIDSETQKVDGNTPPAMNGLIAAEKVPKTPIKKSSYDEDWGEYQSGCAHVDVSDATSRKTPTVVAQRPKDRAEAEVLVELKCMEYNSGHAQELPDTANISKIAFSHPSGQGELQTRSENKHSTATLTASPGAEELSVSSTCVGERKLAIQLPSLSLVDGRQVGPEGTVARIPPPGVLISLFPQIMTDMYENLMQPLSRMPRDERDQLLEEAQIIACFRDYSKVIRVFAYILAGRRLRWKRDALLSQSMGIGPASSKKSTGMKIARVSKQEQEHEDREALEVLSIWKLQVGLLRTTVTAINGHTIKTVEPVPDLQEVTKVQTLKQSEGGLPSRKSCALCGLYRNERVNAVDREERHDSFGEYWDEGSVMHRLCFDFWCTFNEQLETR